MSVADVIAEVCAVVGLAIPDSVFASTRREHVELRALANEIGQRIAIDTHDWSRLRVTATLTGDGTRTMFDLPSDYSRMLKKTSLWPSATPYSRLTHYPDSDQWLGMQVQSFQPTVGGWTLVGDQVGIFPAVASTATVNFYYLSNRFAKAGDGTLKSSFTLDMDSFRLSERLLKLGMIWQWRANKGLSYAEDMATYEDALAYAIGGDKGSNILTVGGNRLHAETFAYPGVLGR